MPSPESLSPPGLPPELRELFGLRVERWRDDLRAGLTELYPALDTDEIETRLLAAAADAYARRPADLHRLDQQRTLRPDWFQSPQMLGYAAYVDRFGSSSTHGAGTIDGVRAQIPYLRDLGVTYLHLLPFLMPREGDSDGGYAVADYSKVRSDLGTMDDLARLASELRSSGISLVADLVVNHVAREHAWALAARDGNARHRAYFHVFDERTQPDAYERTLIDVFPDFAPGSFSWDDDLDAWVWTTFNEFQWDLNWANPDVLGEFADIVFDLANHGIEVLRLDAIAFVWKRLGTTCQNQPEVHAVAQVLRALTRIVCPGVLLKAEAIVAPDDLVGYLGLGVHHGRVSDLAYHNTLMVQVWSMLASRDVRLAVHALQRLPAIPSVTSWITYLRCHDDIGWAIDDADAAAVGLDGFAHRAFLSDYYTGAFPGSDARGLVFQHNPRTGDRRVSGAGASLAGLDAALESADPTAVDRVIARILLAHAVVLGWGGIPVLWSADELGQPNDGQWAQEPGHEDDNRWVHRPRLDTDRQARRHDPATVAGRLWNGLRRLIEARRELTLLHAGTAAQVLDPSDPGVLAVLRRHPEGDLLELFNVTDSWRPFPGERVLDLGLGHVRDRISGDVVTPEADGQIWLAPYRAVWLVDE